MSNHKTFLISDLTSIGSDGVRMNLLKARLTRVTGIECTSIDVSNYGTGEYIAEFASELDTAAEANIETELANHTGSESVLDSIMFRENAKGINGKTRFLTTFFSSQDTFTLPQSFDWHGLYSPEVWGKNCHLLFTCRTTELAKELGFTNYRSTIAGESPKGMYYTYVGGGNWRYDQHVLVSSRLPNTGMSNVSVWVNGGDFQITGVNISLVQSMVEP